MGTNFYRQRKKESFNKELATHYIQVDQILGDKDCLESLLEDYKDCQEIHICKRSYGWKVCFDHNWGVYYQPDRASLTKFLSEDGYEIVDEYGGVYTVDEFWSEIDKHNSYDHNKYDSKLYYEEEQSNQIYRYKCIADDDRRKVEEKFGITTEYNDFYSEDGLRWAVYTDFS